MSIYKTGGAKTPSQTPRQSSSMGPFLIAAGVSLMIGVSAIFTVPGTLSISGLMNMAGLSSSISRHDDEITTGSIASSSVKKLVGEIATELEYLNERVETVAKKSDAGLGQRIDRMNGDLANVKKTVDDVAINMEFLDLRVDKVARAPDADTIGLKKLVADLSTEVDHLNARVETVAGKPDLNARLVDLDFEIEVLKAQIAALKAGRPDTGGWAKSVDDDLATARKEIVGLRSTLDERTTANRNDITALTKRLDKIEAIIAARGDVTASIAPTKHVVAKPKRRVAGSSWVVEAAAEGIAVVKGRSGRFEVKEGSILPGLGRVTDISQKEGRWVVNTTRGPVPFAN
jgi:hypothetical protein